jgi:SAM-dependent methyltransferase
MDQADIKMNVGCGRNIMKDWINLDSKSLPGVDLVCDLDRLGSGEGREVLPIPDGTISEFLLSHVLEHIQNPLPMMQELWRVAKPGAVMTIRSPYGSSDDAWEDPTHVRGIFLQSFGYFSQPFYWRADYGYRGDWQPQLCTLLVNHEIYGRLQGQAPNPTPALMQAIQEKRNVVRELVARIVAVKPAREPRKELQVALELEILDARW